MLGVRAVSRGHTFPPLAATPVSACLVCMARPNAEDAPRRAVRPSVRVWPLRGANASVPLLPRAGAEVV